ncbi:MAG: ketoacyl-ACP synthase III [Planctomycetota bacterium]
MISPPRPAPLPVRIAGVGRYLPSQVVDSQRVADLCGCDGPWLERITGVGQRRWVSGDAGEGNAAMGAAAAQEALQAAGWQAEDVDCLIYAAGTVQQLIPDTSVYVLRALGLADRGIVAHSVHSTCLSFVTGLETAAARIATGLSRRVLVVSSEITSGGLDFRDPESAGLFGDGAAAVALQASEPGQMARLESTHFETYASGAEWTTLKGCGTRRPPNDPQTRREDNLFAMDGPEVLRFTLRKAPRFLRRLLGDLDRDSIDCIIPHQTSKAGLDALERLGMAGDRIVRILPTLGNCVAASIPLALYEAVQSGRLQRGQRALLVGTSAGLTLGGAVLVY